MIAQLFVALKIVMPISNKHFSLPDSYKLCLRATSILLFLRNDEISTVLQEDFSVQICSENDDLQVGDLK